MCWFPILDIVLEGVRLMLIRYSGTNPSQGFKFKPESGDQSKAAIVSPHCHKYILLLTQTQFSIKTNSVKHISKLQKLPHSISNKYTYLQIKTNAIQTLDKYILKLEIESGK